MSDVAFPYPVLGRADDYIDADFQATLRIEDAELVDNQEYKIPYVFDLNDEAILEQIRSGKAKFGFEISCSVLQSGMLNLLKKLAKLHLIQKTSIRRSFSAREFCCR